MSLCRSCGQQVEWVTTTKGKKMPVDPEVVEYEDAEKGTVLVTEGGNVITVNEFQRMPNVRGRISHFATCPQADQWRRG